MKKTILSGLCLILCSLCAAQRVADSAWVPELKTVEFYREGAPLEPPVLTMVTNDDEMSAETRERLVLTFDLLEAEARSLRWSLGHCDADWQRDNLQPIDFMTGLGEGPINEYDFSFTTRTDYVHYRLTLLDRFTQLTHSGNYVLTVTDDASGDTLLTRRFWVSEGAVGIEAEVTRPYDGIGIMQRQEVDVKIEKPQTRNTSLQLRPEYERVMVQQNGRLDNARWLEFSGYDGLGLTYRFRRQNIFDGGNTFRYFDMSNLRAPMYNMMGVQEYGGELLALVRPCEDRSAKHYLSETTLNGGMKVNIWDRQNPAIEADYVWVMLSLPVSQPTLDGSVYVVGALTDWRMDESSRMEYSPERRAYTKRLLLKQGYYAYQLLVGGPRAASATSTYEGDHQETPNTYTIYVYHRSPADRADRLVAVKRVER